MLDMGNEPTAASDAHNSPKPVRDWVRAHPADIVDVFVYVVVLNLAVEYVPSVISETFTHSLVTAVLLKIVLEIVLLLKKAVVARFRANTSKVGKSFFGLVLWGIMIGSKILILELIALVFDGDVVLGGFVSVTLLAVTLLLSRNAVRKLIDDPLS